MPSRSSTWFGGARAEKTSAAAAPAPTSATKAPPPYPVDEDDHKTVALPVASPTATSSAQAVPKEEEIDLHDACTDVLHLSQTSDLLTERLQGWKHAVSYLEDYIGTTAKVHKAQSKEYEKVLKTVSSPLKEGNHFDQSLGGVAGMFENLRANTQSLVNTHLETEKNIHGSVLPILERLHKEIKNKAKELSSGAAKGAKEVEKTRSGTQKHIELLGTQTAAAGSSLHAGSIKAHDDPYLVHRGIYHRLHKQILEENNNRTDLLSVQTNFCTFENHVVEVIQQAMASFNQFVAGQAASDQNLYSDMLQAAQRIPPDFEWQGFKQRNAHLLVDPNSQPRSIDAITFPNQNHELTQAVIEGTLERKSRNKLSMGGYSTGYYVVTPSKYLMEFKDNDNVRKDPTPDLAIYLPDATIGGINGEKFNIKGKDQSGGVGAKLSGSSEIAFKAHNAADAEKWYQVIREAAGNKPAGAYEGSGSSEPNSPISPVAGGGVNRQASLGTVVGGTAGSRNVSGASRKSTGAGTGVDAAHAQEQSSGVTGDAVAPSSGAAGGA